MREAEPGVAENHWAIDKRIPVALIAGMIGQVVAVVWVAAILYSTQAEHTRRITQNETEIKAQAMSAIRTGTDLTRLQVQNENILEAVRRVERVVSPFPK